MTETRMGIQTASKKMLKMYNRNCSNQQVENAVRLINEFKDKIKLPVYDIMLDNPWQTDEDLVETLMFLSRLPVPFYSNFFSLTAYPGTELYELALKDGKIADEEEYVLNLGEQGEAVRTNFTDFPTEELVSLQEYMIKELGAWNKTKHPESR